MSRLFALMVHPARPEARVVAEKLQAHFLEIGANTYEVDQDKSIADGTELLVVLGGDGTILRAAEYVFGKDVPLLGINLGHVGFLAEADPEDLLVVANAIADRTYQVEERMVLQAESHLGARREQEFALNEIALEKSGSRMVEVLLTIDDRPVSRWLADGVLCSTPTGSTAYAFSAGGPVIWPDVEAIQIIPLAAHALFARPLVISPSSRVSLTLLGGRANLVADGLRQREMEVGDRVLLTRSPRSVLFARLNPTPFADRLVAKFRLPVEGWRES